MSLSSIPVRDVQGISYANLILSSASFILPLKLPFVCTGMSLEGGSSAIFPGQGDQNTGLNESGSSICLLRC